MRSILENLRNELGEYNCDNINIKQITNELNNIPESLSISEGILLAQKANRTIKILLAGGHNNEKLFTLLENKSDPLRNQKPSISIDKEKAYNLAMQFYKSNQEGGDGSTLLKASHIGKDIIEAVFDIFSHHGREINDIYFDEPYFTATILKDINKDGESAIKKHRLYKYQQAKKLINIRQNIPVNMHTIFSKEVMQQFSSYNKIGSHLLGTGELFYTLTVIPTVEDATIDNMDYETYQELFFEACDQPREEIGKAQEYLIGILDKAKTLHIQNSDGTDVTISIDGMTFANSLVLKNIPGSEIFSAPVKNSVQGKIVARGRFQEGESPIIEDIRLTIKDGKIINCGAAKNNEAFRKIIFQTPGANYFGEIGIGTNPHLQQHLINGLLVEKVSGSFHMAIGGCYTYPTYNGMPVSLNNGSVSDIHRDITTMLKGQKSSIKVDGKILQQNGYRLDPVLDVLNQGRGVINSNKQPHRWKEKYPSGYPKPTS